MRGGTGGIGNIEIIGRIEKPGVSGISMRVAEFEQRRGSGTRNCESDLFRCFVPGEDDGESMAVVGASGSGDQQADPAP